MSKPIILHTINSLALGGAEVLLRDTVAGLTGFDHVICFLNTPDTLAGAFHGHHVYNLDHRSWKDSFATIREIKKIIKKHRVGIVHAHLFEATLLTRLALNSKLRFYFTIHNMLSKDAFEVNPLSKVAEKLTYKKHHYLISVSNEALKDYDKWIGIRGKSSVLYNYVHSKFFDLSYDYEKPIGDFRMVAVGNLRRQKNYPGLMKAFSLLKDFPISLDIYGSGDMQTELENMIASENIKVRLMGRADDIATVLPQYHAYIMPSLFEGFGIAPMEAMAAGMPVLLSDLEVFRELGEDIPVYFDPKNEVSIAEAIKKVYKNWGATKEKAKKGKALVYHKASKEVYFKTLLQIYCSE